MDWFLFVCTLVFIVLHIFRISLSLSFLASLLGGVAVVYFGQGLVIQGLIILSSLYLCLWSSFEHEENFEFYLFLVWTTLGALFVARSTTSLSLFLSLEVQSISMSVLIALKKRNLYKTEAALKYFCSSALSTSLFLFGLSFVFSKTGYLDFEGLSSEPLALLFVLSALAIKGSLAPFHWWNPDVYQGVSLGCTAFLSTIPFLSLFPVFLSLQQHYDLSWFFLGVACCSFVVGSFGGLLQHNIKRLMAYSGIHNSGFLALGLAVRTPDAFYGCFYVLIIYTLNILVLFTTLLYLKRHFKGLRSFSDLNGLCKTSPFLTTFISITVLSFAGLPLCPGFLGKFCILKAALKKELYPIVCLSLFSSVIAAVYYLKFIKHMFFKNASSSFLPFLRIPFWIRCLIIATVGMTYIIYMKPSLVCF